MLMNEKDLFKILKDVYEERLNLLLQSAPKKIQQSIYLDQGKFMKLKKFIDELENKDVEKVELILELFISISRSWEAFCADQDGNQRFVPYNDSFEDEIFELLQGFLLIKDKQITITQFENCQILAKVKENIKQNINTIEKITRLKITIDDIESYFKQQSFKEYSVQYQYLPFYTFSGYQGKSVFINQRRKNMDTYQMEIEWCIIEGLYFWYIKNNNPFLISSEVLKQGTYPLEEVGDMYLAQVYNTYINYLSPFRMNTSNENKYFCCRR